MTDRTTIETTADLLRLEAEARSACAHARASDLSTTLAVIEEYGVKLERYELERLRMLRDRMRLLAHAASEVERRLSYQIEGGPGDDEEPITRTHPAWVSLTKYSGWRLLDKDVADYLVEARKSEEEAAELDAFFAGLGGAR